MRSCRHLISLVAVLLLSSHSAYPSTAQNSAGKRALGTQELNLVEKQIPSQAQPVNSSKVIKSINYGHSKNNWRDHIDSIITLLGIIAATGMVLFQLNRQHQSGLQLQRDAFKKKTNLSIYENISEVVDKASSAISSVSMSIYNLPLQFDSSQNGKVYFNTQDFNIQHHKAVSLIADALLALEKYEIALPGFRIFRLALNVQSDRVRKAFNDVFYPMLGYIHMEPEKGNAVYLQVPESQKKKFNQITSAYWEELATMASYLSDLQVDTQNKLLSDIFNNKVPRRSPTDTKFMAIACDPEKETKIIEFLRKQSPRQDYFEMLLREY